MGGGRVGCRQLFWLQLENNITTLARPGATARFFVAASQGVPLQWPLITT